MSEQYDPGDVMQEKMALLSLLSQPFDQSELGTKGGRGNFTYVKGTAVIHRLNEQAVEWSFRITSTQMIDMPFGNGTFKPVLLTCGELEIPGLGTRSGMGVAVLEAGAGEDVAKGSATDCLKKCATLFGVALDLYEDGGQNAPQGPQRMDQRQHGGTYQNGGQNAPRGNQGGGGRNPDGPPATERQIKFIYDLLAQTGIEEREVLERNNVQAMQDLRVGSAKEVIEGLKNLAERQAAQAGPTR